MPLFLYMQSQLLSTSISNDEVRMEYTLCKPSWTMCIFDIRSPFLIIACFIPSQALMLEVSHFWTWLKAGTEWKTETQTEWLSFVEKLYFTIIHLFWRYKSGNNINTTHINRFQGCPQSLVIKILFDNITPCDKQVL